MLAPRRRRDAAPTSGALPGSWPVVLGGAGVDGRRKHAPRVQAALLPSKEQSMKEEEKVVSFETAFTFQTGLWIGLTFVETTRKLSQPLSQLLPVQGGLGW